MLDNSVFSALPQALLPWYEANKRDLPWRRDREAYHVWLSEIMLQQTRVEAVKGYYTRFLQALPTVQDLAECDDDRLRKLWEGLGYYSRVRNLKKAARRICDAFGGEFPRDHARVLSLPGIGEYTAGAVCSICFDLPTPAVDGNVLRLVARLTDDHTPIDEPAFARGVRERLREVYPARAGDFTQALMELGATLCGPNREPACEACPCRTFCRGYAAGTAAKLPVKLPKKQRRVEEKTVFVLLAGDRCALLRRPDRGLLASLWQFPDTPGLLDHHQALAWTQSQGLRPRQLLRQVEREHIFTHIQWHMRCFYLEVDAPGGDFVWMTREEITGNAALPTAYRQFWEEMDYV